MDWIVNEHVVSAPAPDRLPHDDETVARAEVFHEQDRASFYRVLEARRDMRHFVSGAQVEENVLRRLLHAAHCAPSVGLMQPWRFVRILDTRLRAGVAALVDKERLATAEAMGARADEFLQLKVEGIRDCAELLVIALPPDDGTVFGRRTLPQEMALCSLACAVENLWLAARAENLGMGWVSLFDPLELAELLGFPQGARPMGVLCLGPVKDFYAAPMLALTGWRHPRSLDDLVSTDSWSKPLSSDDVGARS